MAIYLRTTVTMKAKAIGRCVVLVAIAVGLVQSADDTSALRAIAMSTQELNVPDAPGWDSLIHAPYTSVSSNYAVLSAAELGQLVNQIPVAQSLKAPALQTLTAIFPSILAGAEGAYQAKLLVINGAGMSLDTLLVIATKRDSTHATIDYVSGSAHADVLLPFECYHCWFGCLAAPAAAANDGNIVPLCGARFHGPETFLSAGTDCNAGKYYNWYCVRNRALSPGEAALILQKLKHEMQKEMVSKAIVQVYSHPAAAAVALASDDVPSNELEPIAGLKLALQKQSEFWGSSVSTFSKVGDSYLQKISMLGFDYWFEKTQALKILNVKNESRHELEAALSKTFGFTKLDSSLIWTFEYGRSVADWLGVQLIYSPANDNEYKSMFIYKHFHPASQTYNYVFASVKVSFNLAPDLLIIKTKKSTFWGLFKEESGSVQLIPHTLSSQEVDYLEDYLQAVSERAVLEIVG